MDHSKQELCLFCLLDFWLFLYHFKQGQKMKEKISVVVKQEILAVDSVHDRAVDEETAINAKSNIPKHQTKMKSEPCVKEEVALDLKVDQLVKDVKNCRNQKPKQPKITSRLKRKKHVNEHLESEDLVTEFKEENTKPKISLTGTKHNSTTVA